MGERERRGREKREREKRERERRGRERERRGKAAGEEKRKIEPRSRVTFVQCYRGDGGGGRIVPANCWSKSQQRQRNY